MRSRILSFVLLGCLGWTPCAAAPDERLTLKVRDGEVRETLSLLARVAKANVITENSVTGRVTLNLENVTFKDALAALSAATGLAVSRTGDVYIVAKPLAGGFAPLAPTATAGTDVATVEPRDRLVSFNIKNAELGSVVENIANQSGAQLIVKGSLTDRVSGRVAGLRFEDALAQLLGGTRFGYIRQGSTFVVGDATPGTPSSRVLEETRVIPLAYTQAKSLTSLLPANLASFVKIDPARNAAVVTGTETVQKQVSQLLARLDLPLKQVVLEVKIVELSESGSRDLNVLKSFQNGSATGTGGTTTSALSLAGQLTEGTAVGVFNNVARVLEVVSGLVTSGKGRLLTDTKLNTVSGQKANLDVQTDINLVLTTQSTVNGSTTSTSTVNTLRAGTVVELEPTVQANGNVFAVLSIESSVAGNRASESTAPDISRRKVRNTLLLQEGQTVEIGGLIQTNHTENITRLPVLGYLPLVGQLFSNTSTTVEQRELLVFITPRLRDLQPGGAARIPADPAR